jgi:4-diphosphocytidyl-2-C-methyl-D-erythritol kinase
MLIEQAPAKINLFLHLLGRRADGFHEVDSLAVFAGACDTLTAEPAGTISLRVTGPQAGALGPDNLVLRAANMLAREAGLDAGAALVLEKTLPVASGIGGGSADAAAALRVLGRLWDVPLPDGDDIFQLGADVPVCLASRPARMSGAGEFLSPAPSLPIFGLVLANPGTAVSTADVFRTRTGGFSHRAVLPDAWSDAAAMARDLSVLNNDLEFSARQLCPGIDAVLAALRGIEGCLLARMSGSGATCFGLLGDPDAARVAAENLDRPGWWVWGGAPYPVVEAAAPAD